MSDNPNEAPDTAGVIAPPPLLYAGALAAGLLANTQFPAAFLPWRARWLLGLLLHAPSGN